MRHVRLHRDPQTAELGERAHSGHLRISDHRYNKVVGGRTVLGRILVAAPGTELQDSLDTNVQKIQLLPDDALRHFFAQILHQQPHATVLRKSEGVKTHTFSSVKGPQRADRGSEAVRC